MGVEGKNTQKHSESEKNQQKIKYIMIRSWQTKEIIDLYRTGGWWEMGWNPEGIAPLIRGSFLFIVALDTAANCAVGMGRIIADSSSDGYIQDVVVLPEYRTRGIGSKLAEMLRGLGSELGLSWIGLIAAPGVEKMYERAGFSLMEQYTPMNLDQERPNRYHDTQ